MGYQSETGELLRNRPLFTNQPENLTGEDVCVNIIKSARGFGFTIVGADQSDEEFLQIKNVIPGSPAFEDGRILPGLSFFLCC